MLGFPWFRRRPPDPGKGLEAQVVPATGGAVVRVAGDGLTPAEAGEAARALARQAGLPTFSGDVDHGYDASAVPDPARCPRCGRPTAPKYADLLYTARKGVRVLTCGAARFCPGCPTAVIDVAEVRRLVDPKHGCQGVLGVASPGGQNPALFRTWNGRRTLYLGDEEANRLELTTLPPRSGPTEPERKKKYRRQAAKASRRRNRGGK